MLAFITFGFLAQLISSFHKTDSSWWLRSSDSLTLLAFAALLAAIVCYFRERTSNARRGTPAQASESGADKFPATWLRRED